MSWNWTRLSDVEKRQLRLADLGPFAPLCSVSIPDRYKKIELDPRERKMLQHAMRRAERSA